MRERKLKLYKKTPVKAYAVALMRDDLGLTYAEIGERMGFSMSTGRYLYNQFIKAEKQGIKLWSAN